MKSNVVTKILTVYSLNNQKSSKIRFLEYVIAVVTNFFVILVKKFTFACCLNCL
jgi:hypothetical protein